VTDEAAQKDRRKAALILSLGLYGISLVLPALEFQRDPTVSGFKVLAYGWMGVLTGDVAWLANPAYFAAIAVFGERKHAMAVVAAAIALGLGATTVLAKSWYYASTGAPVKALGPGFYVWMASFLVLLVAAFFVRGSRPAQQRS